MRFLSAAETRQALPMSMAIDAMRSAFGPDTEIPARQPVGQSLVMPGRVGAMSAVKVVSTVPGNPVGIVVVFDSTGTPVGVADGATITAIRTGAGAGLATDLLAPPDATSMAMIGAGAMARDQIRAVREVRDIERIVVWSRDRSNAVAVAHEFDAEVAATPQDAVEAIDIVTTATPSREPLFAGGDLPARVHVNAIGAYLPSMAEIPPEFVREAFVVVDDVAAAAAEAGDLIQAEREADIDIATLLAMTAPPRHDRTLFKSVGVASQDVSAAAAALRMAQRMGIGTVV